MRYFFILLLVFIITIIITYNNDDKMDKNLSKSNVAAQPKNLTNEEKYITIKNSLNKSNVGYGVSDYGKNDAADIPKAYAMFLSAEILQRQTYGSNYYSMEQAIQAGNWLLENADLNNNNVIGWGVPISWDAFGDGSINPNNSEYTISTAIVINGLLDWIEFAPDTAPKEKITSVIEEALKPYLDETIFSPKDLYNYSLQNSDRKYNCFNPAVYMAGQMQRFSHITQKKDLKEKIRKSVDRVMLATYKYKKVSKNGEWYWSYSLEETKTPNDMAHASYIIDGIMMYKKYNGTHKGLFDSEKILKHLNAFSNENNSEWYFYPKFHRQDTLARLYGIGMALHILTKYTNDFNKANKLIQYAEKYKLPNGLYSRWQNETTIITEYLAYYLYGLANYSSLKKTSYFTLNQPFNSLEKQRRHLILKNLHLKDEIEIPLTKFDDNIEVFFNTKSFKTSLKTKGKHISIDLIQGIPVKILTYNNLTIAIFRELISNHLVIVSIDSNHRTRYYKIDNSKNSFYDFREAVIFGDQLALVAYESIKGKNTLYLYDINNCFKQNTSMELPSLEDPAGGTL